MSAFAVGDLVRPKGSRRTHRHQIVGILPPDPALLVGPCAVIQDTAEQQAQRTVQMVDLVKATDPV